MICCYTERNRVDWFPTVIFAVSGVFRRLITLSNRNYSSLRSQYRWNKVLATNVSYARNRKSSVIEVRLCQFVVLYTLNQVSEVMIYLKYAFVVYSLYVRRSKPILRVNCYGEIMVTFEHVGLDIALGVKLWVYDRVYDWVLSHGQRQSFHEKWEHGEVWDLLLQLLA